MAFAATADPERFEEAIAWFRSRFPITEELLEQLGDYAGKRAWTVAGVTHLDLLLTIFEAMREAVENGTDYHSFRKSVSKTLDKEWGKVDSARVETIFRTNLQTAYNRGRYKQLTDADVLSTRPFWLYDAILDSRTTPICKACHGTLLPANHPWWSSKLPPLHHRCRSSWRALTEKQAKRRGITETPPTEDADDGFGSTPNVAEEWRPDTSKYPPELGGLKART